VFSSTVRRSLVAAIAAFALLPAAADAKKHEVKPGRGTLQEAVDKAKPGDKLVLKARKTYTGGVEIDKELTIKGPSDGRKLPTVDGRCRESFTVVVFDATATLKNFKVTGASDAQGGQYGGAEVNFFEGASGSAQDLHLKATCDVLYGVNVFNTGDVLVKGGTYEGYTDAGVYVGGIRRDGSVVEVTGTDSTRNNRGIIIEDSAENVDILVANNTTNGNDNGFNPTGIFLHNAQGVVLSGNVANANAAPGIWLDGTSANNVLLDNQASGNGGPQGLEPADLQNDGVGNCGSGNAFGTTQGNLLGAC
jgi:parallel beta-helix repeat protein